MRIVFMGTPEFAASHLEALFERGYDVVGVFSQPDRARGRGRKLLPTAVKLVATKRGAPVFQPSTVNSGEGFSTLVELAPELIITVAYGKLLKRNVIELPRLGTYNVHASLLPKYRGAAPIQRALENGESETGISIFKIDEGLDTGAIALTNSLKVEPTDTFGTLSDKLEELGQRTLLSFMELIEKNAVTLSPQSDSRATYAPKIGPQDLKLDSFFDAREIRNRIRAYDPYPGVRTTVSGESLKVFQARLGPIDTGGAAGEIVKIDDSGMIVSCDVGSVIIGLVQFPGKKKMHPKAALSGRLLREGLLLGG